MKLAFSTLGCSGLPLPEVVRLAQETGWPGVELRAAPDEPLHIGLSAAERSAAKAELEGVTPLCVASYVKVAAEGDDDECVANALAHAELAKDLGIPAVRVFPGSAESGPEADERAVRRLKTIAPRLPEGVQIWLETHDSHPRGVDVARVLQQVDDECVRAIWDVLHPWRVGEPLTVSAAALHPYLAHVQVKDVLSPTERTPLPLGQGTVPLRDALELLRREAYAGWLSLEWESKWHPEAGPLREALIASRAWLAS
ncbi:MAG: sugar phosphate isomerase/epimerase [Hamadaea sp.]|uniref:sugar phosphate isomerase/epimerase family protein n=1 Tax=Hamadaea sp. TaxID=2024425 RepID=UPI0017BCF540|nr:sugar phosphate isomerase/epimerase family protein [Hamadaea sp.]NUR73888.1 sugar phosphate isomerase/epimerase [Hamadaea sp.]NUT20632.1 sugar phosphate isomerase/epimerase [Hamadaea sp.]